MDFHPLRPSPLPRKDQALQEYINVECKTIKDHLENRNFQLQPLPVREIVKRKVEDADENLKPFAICFLKIAFRMGDDTFLVQGFLTEPKLGTCIRKILQMELQIPKGLKWPIQDVSSVADVELSVLRPFKILASLLLDAQPKISPLLQPSQSTGAIPSSGSILQQPNGTCQDDGLQCLEEQGAKDTGEEVMRSEAPKPDAPQPSGPPRLSPPGGGRRRNEPYPQPYSPRPNRKGTSSSGVPPDEGTPSSGTQGEGGEGPTGSGTQGEGGERRPGSGPPDAPGEGGGPTNNPEPTAPCGCGPCGNCCII